MMAHKREQWDDATRERRADETLFPGAARAALIKKFLEVADNRGGDR